MSFDHQDWCPVILKKDNTKQIHHAPGFKKNQTIISDDPEAPKLLGRECGQQILHARTNKKLTQVELAKQVNIQANIIRDYEIGNVVPDRRVLNLISKKLGIKIGYK